MFSLNIQNDIIFFKDISEQNLLNILYWYNKVEDFGFATGIDNSISLAELKKQLSEAYVHKNEFFVGIFSKAQGKMIGVLKGKSQYNNKAAVWISSLVIYIPFQNSGYGKSAMDLLLNHLKCSCSIREAYLAVVEENQQGKTFWEKQGFAAFKRMDKHIKLHNKSQNVIIMYKML